MAGQTITFSGANYLIEAPSRPTDSPPTGLVVSNTMSKSAGPGYQLQNYGDTTIDNLRLLGAGSLNSGLNVSVTGKNDLTQASAQNSNFDFGVGQVKNDTLVIGSSSANTVNMGSGNDVVWVNFSSTNDTFNLGAGSDQVVFGGGGAINGTTINLGGSDSAVDTVRLAAGQSVTGLVINGAQNNDVLFIGTTQYNYIGSNTWQNTTNPADQRIF